MIVKNDKELGAHMKIWIKILANYNLIINTEKTKVIAISNNSKEINITTEGKQLEQIETCKYLSTIIN